MNTRLDFPLALVLGILLFRAGFVWAANGSPPSVSNQSATVVEATPYDTSLSYSSSKNGGSVTFTILTQPVHGLLTAGGGSAYTYTASLGYSGADSFTWKATNNYGSSSTATYSFTVVRNTAPVASNQSVTANQGEATPIALSYSDPDAQTFAFSVVSGPAHGTYAQSGGTIHFTASNTYAGPDSFTWKVSDGVTSSITATCSITIQVPPPKMVILVVNDLLLAELSTEVNRLQADLVAEGYSATKIKPWSVATDGGAQNLWNYLKGEYAVAGSAFKGTILIGVVPIPYPSTVDSLGSCGTDLCFFNMVAAYGDTSPSNYRIWASRMWASEYGTLAESFFGSEVTLLKRALQANHDYRTGASRLPYDACWCASSDFTGWDSAGSLGAIWPAVKEQGPLSAFLAGGEFSEEISHGVESRYGFGDSAMIQNAVAQVRAQSVDSCGTGCLGGLVNCSLWTRGGGSVLGMGASGTAWAGHYLPGKDSAFCNKLASGVTWGEAMVSNFSLGDIYRPIFHGDLSLKPKMAPANLMPVVNSLTASTASGVAPLTVNFSATASDPDGSITLVEWFAQGHNFGKNAPTAAGTALATSYTYTLPHRWRVRVEVTDEYKARAWKDMDIAVLPRSDQPLRAACGIRATEPGAVLSYAYNIDNRIDSYNNSSLDYTDSQGRLWLHDQRNFLWPYVPSTSWGYQDSVYGGDGYYYLPSASVLGSSDPRLYQWARLDNSRGGFSYTVPLNNGGYTLKLNFADCQNTAAGQRLMDLSVQDVAWLTGYDVIAAAGTNTATNLSTHVDVTGGQLKFTVKTSAASPAGANGCAFLNCFEVLPDVIAKKNPASDFNADGKADVLLRHPSSGSLVLWLMK